MGELRSLAGRPRARSALGVGCLLIAFEGLVFSIVGLTNLDAVLGGSTLVDMNVFGTFVEGSWVAALLPVALASLLGGFWALFGGGRLLVATASVGWLAFVSMLGVGTGRMLYVGLGVPGVLVLIGVWSELRARRRGPALVRLPAGRSFSPRTLLAGAALIAVSVWLLWVVVFPVTLAPAAQEIRQGINALDDSTFEPQPSP